MECQCKYLVHMVEILPAWCTVRTTHWDSGDDVTIATYSLPDPCINWKMPYLLLQCLTDFLLLVLCNVHICSDPLNEHQEQITLLEGGEFWLYSLDRESLEPIVLPWKCHKTHGMELCDEYNNCTKLKFYP